MKSIRFVILLVCIAIPAALHSQEENSRHINNQLWGYYYQYYNFKPGWQFYGEVGARTVLEEWSWFTTYIRPTIKWKKHKLWELHGGIGLFYSIDTDGVNTFELRPWQGFRVNWPNFKHIRFNHYFRLEERFNFPTDNWNLEFNLRIRYRLALKADIYTFKDESNIFLPVSLEFFGNIGQQLTEKFSNRTRLSIGAGYRMNEQWTFELHFVAQTSRTGEDDKFKTSDRLFQIRVRRYLFSKDYRSKTKPELDFD